MSLFQTSVLKKYLKQQDQEIVTKAYKKFVKYFHNPSIQQNIRESKEEQYQAKFLDELFVNIFGYTLNPQPKFNLTTELKNEKNAKKADGAILKDDIALGVIELKSTKTKDLEKVRQQAFDYKANQTGCIYVITSNFEKIRFYINNAVEFEEFNLFTLTEERFALLFLCLSKESLLSNTPLKIKEASIAEEEAITKKFYADYSLFKRELYRDLVKKNMKNEVFRSELAKEDQDRAAKNIKLTLFKKSQKLIDRFLFIFFSEDRGLLPPNSTLKILEQWVKLRDEMDVEVPLYKRYIKYFNYLDTGRRGTDKVSEIFAYNGGLFKPDGTLNSLIIDDQLLYDHTKKLSLYDFESQVDVNILGHIFENSLNEIESVNAEIEGDTFDKQKTKRKKDGVFYTPKYITKYIVDNTVGKLCKEKKAEFGINDEEYVGGRQKATKQKLLVNLESYREWLLQLTILDPACGSGAFLNQALDFLINEHQYLDELQTKLLGGGMVFPNIENTVLENNIFGVDINEESVEIAKLSLWLRTAQPRRKLNDLSSNIKCGNSLIDSKSLAGQKAFKWDEEFVHVFKSGGFDVVIGNPPYVHLEAIKEESQKLSKLGFNTFDKRGDLYPLFVEKGIDLLKPEGVISYIMPNKWLQAGYGENLRGFFLKKELQRLIDFGDLQIFSGATTYPCIFISRNSEPKKNFLVSVLKSTDSFDFENLVNRLEESFETADFDKNTWVISSKKEKSLLAKVSQFKSLEQYLEKGTYRGILTGLSQAFLITEETKNRILSSDPMASSYIHPFLQGRDVKPYVSPEATNYLLLFEKGFTKKNIGEVTEEEAWNWLSKKHPSITTWLNPFAEKGRKRTDKGDYWWEVRACDYYEEFSKPKIMYQAFQVKPCFVYDTSGLYCNNSMWIIPTEEKALVSLLNSKMGWWLITKYCTQIQNGCQLIWKYFGKIPVPEISGDLLSNLSEEILALKQEENKNIGHLSGYIMKMWHVDSLSKKLSNWFSLDYSTFIKELNKVVKKSGMEKLSKADEIEWMELFETKQKEVLLLQSKIDMIQKKIDELVYNLYELNEEEITIIENC